MEKGQDYIYIKRRSEIKRVRAEEIVYIRLTSRYFELYANGDRQRSYYGRDKILDCLPKHFLPATEHLYINMKRIEMIKNCTVRFSDNEYIVLGEHSARRLRQQYVSFIKTKGELHYK